VAPVSLDPHFRRLAAARSGIDRLRGRIDSARDEEAKITTDVLTAKARLGYKDQVQTFLQELQADIHARNVGGFERMLSAFAQEVLQDVDPVRLELYAERGASGLDLFTQASDGAREDILDDQGGALTNVISTGLRMIACIKSDGRKFLVIDEGDCWIKPSNVPSYYSVLADAARRLDLQCLVISHHDVSLLDDTISVARVVPTTMKSATIENDPKLKARRDGPGFRSIRLTDVQAYVDETLYLGPGVTALTGTNNIGKSTVVRALRAVFYGESRDGIVRHGARQATVSIAMEDGSTLEWSRAPKRNPVNLWRLVDAMNQPITRDGDVLETGGRSVPAWVQKITGIGRVDNLDIHISHQKFPVFLLGETPSVRASVLSIGREAGHIDRMFSRQRRWQSDDTSCIKRGEARVQDLRDFIASCETATAAAAALEPADDMLDAAAARIQTSEAISRHLDRAARLAAATATMRVSVDELASTPPVEALDAVAQHQGNASELAKTIRSIGDKTLASQHLKASLSALSTLPGDDALHGVRDPHALTGALSRLESLLAARQIAAGRTEALAALPSDLPNLTDTSAMRSALERLTNAQNELAVATRRHSATRTDIDTLDAEVEAFLASHPHCDSCGQTITAIDLSGGHEHGR